MQQRKIKFRAWDIVKEKMYYENFIRLESWCDNRDNLNNVLNNYSTNAIILMQCTGLKDKNGEEVYEGDILKTESHAEYQVVSNISGCQFELNSVPNNDDWTPLKRELLNNSPSIEIVGNIYQNKNLIN